MLHNYTVTNRYGQEEDRPGVNAIFAFALIIGLVLAVWFACLYSGRAAQIEQMNFKWQENDKEQTLKLEAVKDQYAKLQVRYENAQCQHRGLEVTTVKGITLCMNRDTKALHKIDETAD